MRAMALASHPGDATASHQPHGWVPGPVGSQHGTGHRSTYAIPSCSPAPGAGGNRGGPSRAGDRQGWLAGAGRALPALLCWGWLS